MTNNLLKNLTATFAIVFTVGVGGAWAEEIESRLPKCKGKEKSKWDNCYGVEIIGNDILEGKWINGKKKWKDKCKR